MSPKTIGLIAHPRKGGVSEVIRAVRDEFAKHKIPIRLEQEAAATAVPPVTQPAAISVAKPPKLTRFISRTANQKGEIGRAHV